MKFYQAGYPSQFSSYSILALMLRAIKLCLFENFAKAMSSFSHTFSLMSI